MFPARRSFLKSAAASAALSTTSLPIWALTPPPPPPPPPKFNPQPADWRTFEITTRVEIPEVHGATRVWLPVPVIESAWQHTQLNSYQSNSESRLLVEPSSGVGMLYTEFAASVQKPFVEVTSRVQTHNRALNAPQPFEPEEAAILRYNTRATRLLPTDGIVRLTAQKAIQSAGAKTDLEKVKALYDWVVTNAWREPKVRGCGEGDIKTMLETGNLGGKCADINALFVGLCRSVGIPARDVYGIRLVRSAFHYKELSGNPDSLKGAQHCRAEVYIAKKGWLAMDPADVAKVMRQETKEWIKDIKNPVVQPVYQHLFGGWEGNWLGFNTAHDIKLPNSKEKEIPFFMYPVAENDEGRFDSYAPDAFKYQITAREIV